MGKKKRTKTGGRVAKSVVYGEMNTADYASQDNLKQLTFNNGENAPVLQWGSVFIYAGPGSAYRFNQFKSSRPHGIFRLFAKTKYDQVLRLGKQYDENYIKSRAFAVEDLDKTISFYQSNGWTDLIGFLSRVAVAGNEIHIFVSSNHSSVDLLFAAIEKEYKRRNA